ncbi:MAG: GNAT family N-acetyltransferase [Chitinophagales bacterium]
MTIAVKEHITLRPLRKGDEPAVSEHGNNILIWNYMRDFFPHPYTLQDAINWVDRNLANEVQYNFSICYEDAVIGMIGLIPKKDIDRVSAEIGYWLGEKYWGRGIMTDVLKVYTKHIFNTFEIVRIEAGVFEENIASQKALQKAGFYLESIRKYAYLKNGKYIHGHFYVLLKPELKNGS